MEDPKEARSDLYSYAVPVLRAVLAVATSLALGGIIMLLAGYDPLKAFGALYNAAFGSIRVFGETLVKTTPLLFTGVAVAIAFRGRVFNIGAEGQFLIGTIMAAWIGVSLGHLPSILLIPIVFILGAAGGGLWGLIPGYLKAKHGVSEIITTIMFNFIALRFYGYLVKGPLKEPGPIPHTARISEWAILPYILPGTKLHLGFLLAVLIAVLLYILLFKTYFGYEVRAVGHNPVAANYSGINVTRNLTLTMVISGALAGMGGTAEVLGVAYRLYEGLSPGYGYTAIAVSVLANNNPLGVILSAFVFGVLDTGAMAMQRIAAVSSVIVYVFEGIVVLFLALSSTLTLKTFKACFGINTKPLGKGGGRHA